MSPAPEPDTNAVAARSRPIAAAELDLLATGSWILGTGGGGDLRGRGRVRRRPLLLLPVLVGFDFDSDEDGNFKPIIRLRQGARQQTFEHMILLKKDELLELYLHLQGVHHATGKKGERLFDKIANAMGGARVSAKQFAPMLTAFEKGYKSYQDRQRQGVIATLLEALSADLACQVTYQSPGADPSDVKAG